MKHWLEDFKAEEELRKKRFYKALSPRMKHFALMYFYRLKTDPDNILDYIEAIRFIKSGVCPTDFPGFVFRLTNEQLYAEAYDVLGLPPGGKR